MTRTHRSISSSLARLGFSFSALALLGCPDPGATTSEESSSSGGVGSSSEGTTGSGTTEDGTTEGTGGTALTEGSDGSTGTGGTTGSDGTTGSEGSTGTSSGSESSTGGSATGTEGSTSASSTGGSEESTGTTGETSTGSTDDGTTSGTTGDTEAESGTTGGSSLCEAVCEWEDRCGDITESCVVACDGYLETGYEIDQGCGDARTALVQCRVDASDCAEFSEPGCDSERSEVHLACNGDPTPYCGDVGPNVDDPFGDCVYEVGCLADPGRRIECNIEGCGCRLGGVFVGGCSGENACEIEDVAGFALECCGWADFHEY